MNELHRRASSGDSTQGICKAEFAAYIEQDDKFNAEDEKAKAAQKIADNEKMEMQRLQKEYTDCVIATSDR